MPYRKRRSLIATTGPSNSCLGPSDTPTRAYIFDNSIKNDERVFVAEFESPNNVTLQIEEHRVPKWFVTYVSDKLK